MSVQVLISDTGSGIPTAILNSIFEPFVTTKPNGTGLGLTMVRSMVDRGQGTIDVSSSTKGTQFLLCFPLSSSKSQLVEQTSLNVDSKVVLVVDDEHLVLQTISRILKMNGYEVRQASGVTLAKEVLRNQDVDLVLSDINLSGETGIDLRHFCLREFPGIPFLLMTGFISQELDVDLPVIEKPLSTQELLSFIRQGLANTTEEMPN